MFLRILVASSLGALLAFSAGEAPAQQWPSRPIRFTVPLPPGGANDLLARVFAERLQPVLGQPVVVENKPGAGGNVGTEFVGKQAPDIEGEDQDGKHFKLSDYRGKVVLLYFWNDL